jgi:hypothetical protein
MPLLKLWNSIRGRSTNRRQAETDQVSEQRVAGKSRTSSGFGLFGGGPHSSLCKRVKSIPARSVLEISVDDGSRAIAVMKTLAQTRQNVRYLAIDQFEMAGSGNLKRFYQKLRAEQIRPQLFPETIDRGLIRVAHTVGTVDLVLIAAPVGRWQVPTTRTLLCRISHARTVILFLDDDHWRQLEASGPGQLPQAA